jgi:hypothetical protein
MTPRVDKVSRFAAAPPERIFQALLDSEQLADGHERANCAIFTS